MHSHGNPADDPNPVREKLSRLRPQARSGLVHLLHSPDTFFTWLILRTPIDSITALYWDGGGGSDKSYYTPSNTEFSPS